MDRYFKITRNSSDLVVLSDISTKFGKKFTKRFVRFCKIRRVPRFVFKSPKSTRYVYFGIIHL